MPKLFSRRSSKPLPSVVPYNNTSSSMHSSSLPKPGEVWMGKMEDGSSPRVQILSLNHFPPFQVSISYRPIELGPKNAEITSPLWLFRLLYSPLPREKCEEKNSFSKMLWQWVQRFSTGRVRS